MERSKGCALAAWRHRRVSGGVEGHTWTAADSLGGRTDQQVLGDVAHQVLEDMVDAGWPGPEWEAEWDVAWSRRWDETKPRTNSRLADLPNVYVVQHGLRRWLSEAAARGIAARGAWAEEGVGIDDYPVEGRIDLLTMDGEDRYGVWDLKTGIPPPWDDGPPEQLLLYAALVAKSHGPVGRLGIIGRIESMEWPYEPAMADAVLDRYRCAAAAMASPIPPAARVEVSACVRCPWLDTCDPARKSLFDAVPTGTVHVVHDHPSGQYLTLDGPHGHRWQTPALYQPNGLPVAGCEVDVLEGDGTIRAVARSDSRDPLWPR